VLEGMTAADAPLTRVRTGVRGAARPLRLLASPARAAGPRRTPPASMQQAACNRQHATCSMQQAACNMQHATGSMQHAACNRQHAIDNMQQAACNRQHAAGSMRQQSVWHPTPLHCPTIMDTPTTRLTHTRTNAQTRAHAHARTKTRRAYAQAQVAEAGGDFLEGARFVLHGCASARLPQLPRQDVLAFVRQLHAPPTVTSPTECNAIRAFALLRPRPRQQCDGRRCATLHSQ
jgi:hypothetical protein